MMDNRINEILEAGVFRPPRPPRDAWSLGTASGPTVDAITPEDMVPPEWTRFIELNANYFKD